MESTRKATAGTCVRRHACEVAPVQLRTSRVPDEARDGVDERRLAGPVRPDQSDELTLFDDDVDVVDGAHAAETDGQAGRGEDGGHEPLTGAADGAGLSFRLARTCAVR